MTSESWEDVFVVFDAALATSGVERDGFLVRECGDNARLREKVESLLAAHRDAEGFLSGGQVRATRASGGPSSPVFQILAPGTRIGVFEVEGFAGAGGMGEVYRARDTRLDRHVALKILSPDATTDIRARARLAYEARAIARLSHPHICALHDIGHHDGVDFLVMEYLDGETLASRLRRAPLPVAEAVRIAIADRGRARRGTYRRHRAQRSQAGQHHAGDRQRQQGWSARIEAARLRPRPVPAITADLRIGTASRRSHGVDSTRCDRRHSTVHGARTGARRGGGSPKRHLLVWMRALRDGLRAPGVRRRLRRGCHVRDPPCGSIGPADRSVPIGRSNRERVARVGESDQALPRKGAGSALQRDARRENRASCSRARRGGNKAAPLETTGCRRGRSGCRDRRGGLASSARPTFTVGAPGHEGRAIDVPEWSRKRADVFSRRHAGGVLLERRARGQLRHLREDHRLIGSTTTDDRSCCGHASHLVSRRQTDRVSPRPRRRRNHRVRRSFPPVAESGS